MYIYNCISPMMDSKFFTPEEEEILIDLISEYPPLYSHKDEAFKDKELKATIWKKIADSLGKNEETCKTKWKNLRDYYNKKKRVATLSNTSGTSGNSRKYDRYLRMKFLEESDPRSNGNMETITVSEEENTQEEYEHSAMKDVSLEYDQNASGPAGDPDEESPSQPYKKAKVGISYRSGRHRTLMEYLQASGEKIEMNEEMHSPKNIIMYDDENETPPYATFPAAHGDPLEDFFRGIITTVRTFSPELQLKAKRSISNIVFDLEQEALSNKASTPDIQTINNGR